MSSSAIVMLDIGLIVDGFEADCAETRTVNLEELIEPSKVAAYQDICRQAKVIWSKRKIIL